MYTRRELKKPIKPPPTVKCPQNIARLFAGSLLSAGSGSGCPVTARTAFVTRVLPLGFWADAWPFLTVTRKTFFSTSPFCSLCKTSPTCCLRVYVGWRSREYSWAVSTGPAPLPLPFSFCGKETWAWMGSLTCSSQFYDPKDPVSSLPRLSSA